MRGCDVPLSEPGWWYGEATATSLMPRLLSPFAWVYGAVAKHRLQRKPKPSPLPVICVGNLTAGGSGKTPMVRELTARLRALGERPAVLSRGHGGKQKGPVWVDTALHSASDVGDEPLMLAQDALVMVARDRHAGSQAIAQSDATVIVLDDGLQNHHIAKNLTFALVDRHRGVGNARVIPAGPLRAPLAAQFEITDAIVLTGLPGDISPTVQRLFGHPTCPAPHLSVTTTVEPCRVGNADNRAVVFAGIANPARVFESAKRAGLTVVGTREFPDHHPFTSSDIDELKRWARANEAALVTTEKDHQRLVSGTQKARALAETCTVLKIGLDIDAANSGALDALLQKALGR